MTARIHRQHAIEQTPGTSISLLSIEGPKTCNTCVRASRDATSGVAMCNREPDLVTGKPVQLCHTERLIGMTDKLSAMTVADQLGVCGPQGTYWEEFVPAPPVPRLTRWGNFWAFWRS